VTDVIVVALIVGVSGMLGPILLAQVNWRRQDEVAAKVAEAAALLVESNARATIEAENTRQQLKEIHVLVNSDMTTALQDTLESTERELVSLRKLLSLDAERGHHPSVDDLAMIEATESRIADMRSELITRLKQTKAVDLSREDPPEPEEEQSWPPI